MPQPQTKDGKLSDLARHVVQPSGIVSTGWPAVRDTCAKLEITFDGWQDGAGRLILSKRKDGSYACSVGGVVISIPRQVGKTFLIGAIVFALCLLFPGITVLWTAHHTATANETFTSLLGFSRRRKIAPHVSKRLVDDMTIEFHNGSRIMFGARERGFGRGFTNVSVLVFDEAQILTEKAMDDMLPTTNTAANPLLLMMGTPPKPTDPSEVFMARRSEALAGDSDDMAYIEFSADEDADPDDRKQWAKANPSYPHRTNANAIRRMQKNLTPDSFRREALGIWDDLGGSLFDLAAWQGLAADKGGERPKPVAFSVVVSDDRKWGSICLAGTRSDGKTHLQVVQSGRGTDWMIQRLVELNAAWRPMWVAVMPSSPAGPLVDPMETAGLPVLKVNGTEAAAACAGLLDDVNGARVAHVSATQLNVAVQAAKQKQSGQTWVWARNEQVDISPLWGVTLARFALGKPGKKRSGVVW